MHIINKNILTVIRKYKTLMEDVNNIYTSTNNIQTISKISLFFGIIIGLLLTIIGAIIIFRKRKYDKTTEAKVTKSVCNKDSATCKVSLKYFVNDKTYNKDIDITYVLKEKEIISILYNSYNPDDIYIGTFKYKAAGIIILSIGILLISLIYLFTFWQ